MTDFRELATAYLILVEGGPPSNFSAWSPDLPGCAGIGNTLDECVTDMRSAISFHLEGIATDGEPFPEPSGPGVYVEIQPHVAA